MRQIAVNNSSIVGHVNKHKLTRNSLHIDQDTETLYESLKQGN